MAKKQITVTSRGDLQKTRNLALARRLAGNVHGGAPRALPLNEPDRWQVYEANTYANENEFYLMRERGWVPLEASDLACPIEESGYRLNEAGALVRGERGKEMLWKMEKSDYAVLMAAKTAQNNKGIGSAKQTRQDLANAIAGPMGSEAADFIYNSPGSVIDTITGGEAQ